jgi:hypothetical protein
VRALLVLIALTLLPGLALAHGDHAQSNSQEKRAKPSAAAPWTPARDAVSPACPTPVHACGCGNLSLCDAGSKPPAALGEAGLPCATAANDGEAPLLAALPPRASSKRSPHSPRAPPLL